MFLVQLSLFIGLLSLFYSPVQAKFPTDPAPCNYGDINCILGLMNYYVHEKSDGDSSINLIKIDPLSIPKISIKQGGDGSTNLDIKFTDTKILGLKTLKFYKASGFGKDMGTKNELHLKADQLSLVGDYSIIGRILILPINGHGKSNMTILNSDYTVTWIGKPYEKNGEIYMKMENTKLKIRPGRLYYHMSNLFNGDKILGDSMNAFLNENWKDVFSESQKTIEDAFVVIFEAIVNNIFSKYPYEKFFAQ